VRPSITCVVSGFLVAAAGTGCTCGDLVVSLYPAGAGEPARSWRVGDTASVWAEVGYENNGGDIQCPRYGSRPAPNYRGQVEPDSFTFQSSHPDVASVTDQGLVTVLLVGQTEITAMSSGVVSRPLRITVQR
jgi:hypothetical protein